MNRTLRTLSLLLLAAACTPDKDPARAPDAAPTTVRPVAPLPTPEPAPQKQPDPGVADGNRLTISFPDRTNVVLIPAKSEDAGKAVCTLAIEQSGLARQTMITVGTGETEALTCGRLVAAGRIPARKTVQRIALLYKAFGPHETVLQPVVLVRENSTMPWALDDALAQKIGEDGRLNTIPAIRRWVSEMRPGT